MPVDYSKFDHVGSDDSDVEKEKRDDPPFDFDPKPRVGKKELDEKLAEHLAGFGGGLPTKAKLKPEAAKAFKEAKEAIAKMNARREEKLVAETFSADLMQEVKEEVAKLKLEPSADQASSKAGDAKTEQQKTDEDKEGEELPKAKQLQLEPSSAQAFKDAKSADAHAFKDARSAIAKMNARTHKTDLSGGFEVKKLPGRGDGLVTTRILKKASCGNFSMFDRQGCRIMSKSNDAAQPDWQRIFIAADGDVDEMVRIFEEYRRESLEKVNIEQDWDFGSEATDVCKLMNDMKLADINPTSVKFRTVMVKLQHLYCLVLKDIPTGEELVRHYDLEWLSLVYLTVGGPFAKSMKDHTWCLTDIKNMMNVNIERVGEKPGAYEKPVTMPGGDYTVPKEDLVWVCRQDLEKWKTNLEKMFLVLFEKEPMELRAKVRYRFMMQCLSAGIECFLD